MEKIAIFGTGYVGLVTGVCLAELGHEVSCIDKEEKKINALNKGNLFLFEPGLEELYRKNRQRIVFTTDAAAPLKKSDIIFICVGTPEDDDGRADLKAVKEVARLIGNTIDSPKIVIMKSTVPVGTNRAVAGLIEKHLKNKIDFWVVSNPEFLREGLAVKDFFEPDRIVIGSDDRKAAERVKNMYGALKAPVFMTGPETAELIKYASNAFLATKISFINAVSQLCEACGADVKQVAEGMGLDKRIGKAFLAAGPGFGGSCFPKDCKALVKIAHDHDCHFKLLNAVLKTNEEQKKFVVSLLEKAAGKLKGKKVAVFGLAFKGDTDDVRESPALDIIGALLEKHAVVQATDPEAVENFRAHHPKAAYFSDPYSAARGADVLLILTEWEEFKELDYEKILKNMAGNILLDARNLLDGGAMKKAGFIYKGIGR